MPRGFRLYRVVVVVDEAKASSLRNPVDQGATKKVRAPQVALIQGLKIHMMSWIFPHQDGTCHLLYMYIIGIYM